MREGGGTKKDGVSVEGMRGERDEGRISNSPIPSARA